MVEIIGWIGAICFAICGIPQAIQVYRTKKVTGLSFLFLITWLAGELFSLVYILLTTHFQQAPIILNYSVCLVITGYLLYAKLMYPITYQRDNND